MSGKQPPDGLLLGYGRKSYIDPNDRKAEESSDLQAQRLSAFADEQGNRIELYIEPDGRRSGSSIHQRPAYQQLIARIESARPGDIAGVILTDVDRAGRLEADLHALFDLILERGLSLRVLDNPQFDIESTDGRFMAGLQVLLAARERRKTSDRIKAWAKHRQDSGTYVGREPYGYHWAHMTDANGHAATRLEPDPIEIERLVAMYERYVTTETTPARIADWANEQGWPTRSGQPWTRTTVDNLIWRVMHYRGFLVRHPPRVRSYRAITGMTPASHPITITAELALAVDDARKRRMGTKRGGQRPNHVYILQGLIHCAACGSPVYCTDDRRRRDLLEYYQCGHRLGTCTAQRVRCEVVERQVWSEVAAFAARLRATSIVADIARSKPTAPPSTSTIAALEGEMHRLNTLFVKGRIAEDAYERDYARLQKRIETATAAISSHHDDPLDIEAVRLLLTGFTAAIAQATPEAARAAAQALIADVRLREATVELVRFVPVLERVREVIAGELDR